MLFIAVLIEHYFIDQGGNSLFLHTASLNAL